MKISAATLAALSVALTLTATASGEPFAQAGSRFARASPLRWGKRAAEVLRWGKREPLRWGKRSVEAIAEDEDDGGEHLPRMAREAPLR